MKQLITFTVTCLLFLSVKAQEVTLSPLNHIGFENAVPENVKATKGQLTIDTRHRVAGKSALRWDYKPGDVLTIRGDIGYQIQDVESVTDILGDKYPQSTEPILFTFPMYSESVQDTKFRIGFGHNDDVDCFTDLIVGFSGWRKFTLPYDRGHLRGEPKVGMNFMQIEVLTDNAGTIYLDDLVFAKRDNPRSIKADPLLPLLKNHPQRYSPAGARTTQTHHLNKPWFSLQEDVTPQQKMAFETIDDRLWELEFGGHNTILALSDKQMQKLESEYNKYEITRDGDVINGLHLDLASNRKAFNLLAKNLSIKYHNIQDKAQKEKLAKMLMAMIEHGIDCDQNLNWYNGRGFAEACYLMKDELKAQHLQKKAIDFLRRKYQFSRFYNEDVINGRHGAKGFCSDDLYTCSVGYIICIMMMDDSPEKVRDMQHFISFYSNIALNYANGLTDSFKPDGSHYHHANAYLTRYGYYTMPKVCEVVRIFAQTEFAISEEAHERMKHNVLIRRFYRSKHYFPWAYSHNKIMPVTEATYDEFLHLALAGSPDKTESIDKDIAAAYLRQMEGKTLPKEAQSIADAGIEPEATPQGHHTLSYHAKSIYRKDEWMAVVGAHSRYVYALENWSWHATRGNTKFGMFENWGSLELIYPDKEGLKQVDNGRSIEGWDWTMIPGVTSVNAPLDKIKLQTLKIGDDAAEEHLYSDQEFVGGLDFSDGNGLFVSKVRGHDKYKLGSFYATKSWFFFNDLIICLGSDIRNNLPQYTTHTTLFQNAMSTLDFDMSINKKKVLKDKYFDLTIDGNNSNWIIDSRNTGYYIAAGNALNVSYNLQQSRDFQDRTDTEGVHEKARIEHGNAPDGAEYEYAVKMNATADEMMKLSAQQSSQENTQYNVIQKNDIGHIVHHTESNTTAYIMFQQEREINNNFLQGVSHSGIFMIKEKDKHLTLAVADPDLRLYEGFSSDIDLQLKRSEVSSYGNYWHGNNSIASTIKVFLKGDWTVDAIVKGNGKIIQQGNGITVIEFSCKDGLTNEIVLK